MTIREKLLNALANRPQTIEALTQIVYKAPSKRNYENCLRYMRNLEQRNFVTAPLNQRTDTWTLANPSLKTPSLNDALKTAIKARSEREIIDQANLTLLHNIKALTQEVDTLRATLRDNALKIASLRQQEADALDTIVELHK